MTHKNLIAGEWLTGEPEIENRNPSGQSDLVGLYSQTSAEQLDATLDAGIQNVMFAPRTGVATVNHPTAGTDYHVPFGGRGDSSYGPREQGKTAYISAGPV